MADLDDLADQLSRLTVSQAIQLGWRLLDRAGVLRSAPPVSSSGTESYTLTLTGHGHNKIMAIKLVREVTTLGLKEAKDLVESTPRPVKHGLTISDAEDLRRRFIEIGADAQVVRDL